MVRGHVPSAATKAKISASLKGNKNAFRGGPKKPLTTRDKVANINAAAKRKQFNLTPEQLERRRKVAQRLRGIARKEEAGIVPARSKSIPKPNGPDPVHAQDDAIEKANIRGSLAHQPVKSDHGTSEVSSKTVPTKKTVSSPGAGATSRANPPTPYINKRQGAPAPLKQGTGRSVNDIMADINKETNPTRAKALIAEYNKAAGIPDEKPLGRRPPRNRTRIPRDATASLTRQQRKVNLANAKEGNSTMPIPNAVPGSGSAALKKSAEAQARLAARAKAPKA